jgi:hypothetical protein
MTELAREEHENFSAITRREGAHVAVQLTGTADAEQVLARVFGRIHAMRTDVVVDLRGLEQMSASCLQAVLAWVSDIQELPAGDRYSVRFIANAELPWQTSNLHAVQSFARDLITVTH